MTSTNHYPSEVSAERMRGMIKKFIALLIAGLAIAVLVPTAVAAGFEGRANTAAVLNMAGYLANMRAASANPYAYAYSYPSYQVGGYGYGSYPYQYGGYGYGGYAGGYYTRPYVYQPAHMYGYAATFPYEYYYGWNTPYAQSSTNINFENRTVNKHVTKNYVTQQANSWNTGMYGGDFTMSNPSSGKSYGGDFTIGGSGSWYGGDYTMSASPSYGGDFTMSGSNATYGGDYTVSGAGANYGGDFTMSNSTPTYGGDFTMSGNDAASYGGGYSL